MSMKWKHKGREFESIGYQLKDKKTMIIYGAGDYAEDILNVYEGSECKDSWKLWLVDRDEKKQQEGKRGYRVMSPEELWKKEKENYFVVICATPSGAAEIKKGLLEHEIKEEDIYRILEAVLYEFPISEVQFYIPKWVEMLPVTHKIKQDLLEHIQKILEHLEEIRDAAALTGRPESPYIKDWYVEQIQMDTGCVIIQIHMYEKYYYEMLSEMTGTTITGQYDLIKTMQKLSILKNEYENVEDAFTAVRMKGYGVVSPTKEEIVLDEPEIIRQGKKNITGIQR